MCLAATCRPRTRQVSDARRCRRLLLLLAAKASLHRARATRQHGDLMCNQHFRPGHTGTHLSPNPPRPRKPIQTSGPVIFITCSSRAHRGLSSPSSLCACERSSPPTPRNDLRRKHFRCSRVRACASAVIIYRPDVWPTRTPPPPGRARPRASAPSGLLCVCVGASNYLCQHLGTGTCE